MTYDESVYCLSTIDISRFLAVLDKNFYFALNLIVYGIALLSHWTMYHVTCENNEMSL